jgi:hypothetical protein
LQKKKSANKKRKKKESPIAMVRYPTFFSFYLFLIFCHHFLLKLILSNLYFYRKAARVVREEREEKVSQIG